MPDMSGSRSPWRRRSVWRFCVNGGVGHCTRTTRVVRVPTCRVRARLRVTEGGSTPDADRQFGVRPASGVRRRHHAGVSRALTPRLPGGSVPVATSQPMAATWALITLAMPRPTPGAAAHTTASGHLEPSTGGVKHRVGRLVLADSPVRRPNELRGDGRAHHADDHRFKLPHPPFADQLGHTSHIHAGKADSGGQSAPGGVGSRSVS
jgi:hypothetical protein